MKIWITLIISCGLTGCTKLGPYLTSGTLIVPGENYFLNRADEYCYRQWLGNGFVYLWNDTFRFEIHEEGKVPDSAQYRKTILAKKGRGAFDYIFSEYQFLRKEDYESKWFQFAITYSNNNRPITIIYWFRLADPNCFSPY